MSQNVTPDTPQLHGAQNAQAADLQDQARNRAHSTSANQETQQGGPHHGQSAIFAEYANVTVIHYAVGNLDLSTSVRDSGPLEQVYTSSEAHWNQSVAPIVFQGLLNTEGPPTPPGRTYRALGHVEGNIILQRSSAATRQEFNRRPVSQAANQTASNDSTTPQTTTRRHAKA